MCEKKIEMHYVEYHVEVTLKIHKPQKKIPTTEPHIALD